MALTDAEIDVLVDSIIHGAEEKYVTEVSNTLIDNMADGVLSATDVIQLETLAKANTEALQTVLIASRDAIDDEVMKQVQAVLNDADNRDVADLSAYYGTELVASTFAGATTRFTELSYQAARGLSEVISRCNIAMSTAAETLWYQVTGNAITATLQGLKTTDAAIAEAVLKLQKSGLTTIDYSSGISNQVDVAARRHIITQVSQAGGDMTMARLKAINHTLVITSAHFGARPSHEEWQGKPCSTKGTQRVDGVTYPDLYALTGYGTVSGLKGANCKHSFGPYYPGITDLPDTTFAEHQKKYGMTSAEYFAATQKQRTYERAIRATKRDIAGLERAGLGLSNTTYVQKRLLLGKQQSTLRTFCSTNNLSRQYSREKAYGVSAQPKALTGAQWTGTMKAKAAKAVYPTTQAEIDELVNTELSGIKFTVHPTYNERIRTPGATVLGKNSLGEKYVKAMNIGKQAKPGNAELIDTLIHEELEARIWLNFHGSEKYWLLNSASDDERHAYIQKIIDKYVKMKGIK